MAAEAALLAKNVIEQTARERGAAMFHRFVKRPCERAAQPASFGLGEAGSYAAIIQLGVKEYLVAVDVAHAYQYLFVQQERFERLVVRVATNRMKILP